MVYTGAAEVAGETKDEIGVESDTFVRGAPDDGACVPTGTEDAVTYGMERVVFVQVGGTIPEEATPELGANVPWLYVGLKDKEVDEVLLAMTAEPVPWMPEGAVRTTRVLPLLVLVAFPGPVIVKLWPVGPRGVFSEGTSEQP
jgi:hypothetical protein